MSAGGRSPQPHRHRENGDHERGLEHTLGGAMPREFRSDQGKAQSGGYGAEHDQREQPRPAVQTAQAKRQQEQAQYAAQIAETAGQIMQLLGHAWIGPRALEVTRIDTRPEKSRSVGGQKDQARRAQCVEGQGFQT